MRLLFFFLLLPAIGVAQVGATLFPGAPDWIKAESPDLPPCHPNFINTGATEIYTEKQRNFLTDECFERHVSQVCALRNRANEIEIGTSLFPTANQLQKLTLFRIRNGKTEDITDQVLIRAKRETEQVGSDPYYARERIAAYVPDPKVNDLYDLQVLTTNLRQDIARMPIFESEASIAGHTYYRFVADSTYPITALHSATPRWQKLDSVYVLEWKTAPLTKEAFEENERNVSFPRLVISPFATWLDFERWISRLFAVEPSSTEACIQKQQQLTAGLQSEAEKIAAIVNYVQDSINYLEYGLYQPTQPAEVIREKHGDCKSKSLLGATMLQSIGVPSWPILVNMGGYEDDLLHSTGPTKFNHCVIQFVHQGDTVTVDPTVQYQGDEVSRYPIPDFARGFRVLKSTDRESLIPLQDDPSIEVYDYLHPDEGTMKRVILASGYEADRLRLLHVQSGADGLNSLLEGFPPANYQAEVPFLRYGFNPTLGEKSRWNPRENPVLEDLSSPIRNEVRVTSTFICVAASSHPLHQPPFQLQVIKLDLKRAAFAEDGHLQKERIRSKLTHRMTIDTEGLPSELMDSFSDTAYRVDTKFLTYHLSTSKLADSIVLQQSYQQLQLPTSEEAAEYAEAQQQALHYVDWIKEAPWVFDDYVTRDEGPALNRREKQNLLRFLLFFGMIVLSVIGLVWLFRKLGKRLRGKRAKRTGSTLGLLLLVSATFGQTVPQVDVPAWVQEFSVDGSSQNDWRFDMLQQEVQINASTSQRFERYVFEISRPVDGSGFFNKTFTNNLNTTVALAEYYITRNGKRIPLDYGRVQAFSSAELIGSKTQLNYRESLTFYEQKFEPGDQITIGVLISELPNVQIGNPGYVIRPYGDDRENRMIIRVLAPEDLNFHFTHIDGLGTPKKETQNGQTVWIWDDEVQLPEFFQGRNVHGPTENPTWFYVDPVCFVSPFSSEQDLAGFMQNYHGWYGDEASLPALQNLLQQACSSTTDRTDSIKQLISFLTDSLRTYPAKTLLNKSLSSEQVLHHRIGSSLEKSLLFAQALDKLDISNELFLVNRDISEPDHQQSLSPHLFNHAIVRFSWLGDTYTFDLNAPYPIQNGLPAGHVDYRFGLNLTNPTTEKRLSDLEYPTEDRILVTDTILDNEIVSRTIHAQGWPAQEIRRIQMHYENNDLTKLLSNHLLRNVNEAEKLMLNFLKPSTREESKFQVLDSGKVRFQFQFKTPDLWDASNKWDASSSSGLFIPKTTLVDYNIGLLERFKRFFVYKIDYQHKITVRDTTLQHQKIPILDVQELGMHIQRGWSQQDSLFTFSYHYYSPSTGIQGNTYKLHPHLDRIYDATPDDLTVSEWRYRPKPIHKSKPIESYFKGKFEEIPAYLYLLLVFPLLGLFVTLRWILLGIFKRLTNG